MPLESPQAVRDRLDAVTSKLLDGEISTNVAETARKLLATAADTFKAEANTALAPATPQAPALTGAAPGGATFNITFATTPHGPVFEAAPEPASAPAQPPIRTFEHPQPPQAAPPQIVDVEPQASRPPAPPNRQKQERQQATALLLARHRRK